MCGICGAVGIEERGLIDRMTEALRHRGPDDRGVFFEGDAALGHRRLSIIDPEGGSQPMQSPDGSLVLVFNGEIYNFRELRERLGARGLRFQTDSDTEVLLRLFELEGPAALARLNGMFAFAVWDRSRRELFLARDRLGIKPLYYLVRPGELLFASETKALLCHRGWSPSVDPRAIHDYLALRYAPGGTAMFREVRRLPAGHYLRYREGKLEVRRYWSPPRRVDASRRFGEELVDELGELLERSVRRRLVADVPVGAYLSGGLDSSLVAALATRLGGAPLRTYAVGFGSERDELSEAADTARRLGCDHREVRCLPEDMALLPEIVRHSDEPLGDPIAIPLYRLAREAKRDVSVVLTGEGADEIFGGYLFHKVMWAAGAYPTLVSPALHRRFVAPLLERIPTSLLDVAFQYPAYLGERGKRKALDYLGMLHGATLDQGYRHLISLFDARDTGSLYTPELEQSLSAQRAEPVPRSPDPEAGSGFAALLGLQLDHWLPDNMLLRQDKMSMAHGLEARVPYLDHELVEFALQLPRRVQLRGRPAGLVGKALLRRLARRWLPSRNARRRKLPFYFPIEAFFRHPLFTEMVADL